MFQDDWLMLADKFGTSHTPTIVMPRHGTRIGTLNPMPSSSTLTNSPPTSTSNYYPHSSYQTSPTWALPSASIPSTPYPGSPMKPGRYRLRSVMTMPPAPSTSGPQYDNYEVTMKLWHRFTVMCLQWLCVRNTTKPPLNTGRLGADSAVYRGTFC